MPQNETTADEALRLEIAAELKAHREARAAIEALPTKEREAIKMIVRDLHWALDDLIADPAITSYNALRAELETAIYPIYLKRRNEKA